MQDWETGEIPEDLMIEIAARLPAKSVMRFKCISKFWSSLPLSTHFCNRFLTYQSQQPRFYMSLVHRLENTKSLLLSSTPTTTCPCPSSSLEFHQDLTIGGGMVGNLLRVLHGFICFTVKSEARIYNPSTRQLVILPCIQESFVKGYPHYFSLYFICHDPVSDQYKLLCVITALFSRQGLDEQEKEELASVPETISEHWVFVLEAGGSWKRVAEDFRTPHHPSRQQVTMNNVLYYMAFTDSSQTCVLVSFDIRSEELSMIKLPPPPGKRLALINYGGKVAVFDFSLLKENGLVDLWVVEHWRNKEWSRKTLFLQPCQMHLVTHCFFTAKGTTLKGQVLLVPQYLIPPFYFLCYDFQLNHLKKVEISGIPDHWFTMDSFFKSFDVEFMDPTENVKYLES
ncbi:unnamed protein product [Brassica rapa subsp. narinosa]